MAYRLSVSILCLAASQLWTPAAALPAEERGLSGPHYLFTFGDSYTKTGFKWDGTMPNDQNPLGNPAIGKGTSSGGDNWLGYLVTRYNKSTLYTYNFAIGGSTVDKTIVDPNFASASDFPHELALWDKYIKNKGKPNDWGPDNSVFAVWFGVNDVNKGFHNADLNDQYTKDIHALFDGLDHLVAAGAKNFMILGLPPISRTPEALANTDADRKLRGQAGTLWNSKLAATLKEWQKTHPHAFFIDAASAFNEVLDNPSKFDLPNDTCFNTDGTSCPWWDILHPGEKIQLNVAKKVAATVSAFFPSFFHT